MAEARPDWLPACPDARATVYVADRNLDLVYSNDAWTDFAQANRGDGLLAGAAAPNLLASMSGSAKARWQAIYQLLLEGRLSAHEEQFNCSSPTERRTYRLRIAPQLDKAGNVTHLVHQTVPVDHATAIRRLTRDLVALQDAPDRTRRSYRTRVIERRIEIASFDTCRHLRPLDEIGGDMLWHRGYADGSVDLVIADAMGHGEPAGLLATQLSFLLDEVARADRPPADVVAALNAALKNLPNWADCVFATGLFLRFDPRGQALTACSFGHEGPIFSRTGQVPVPSGPPAGLDLDLGDWPEHTLDFDEHGRRFLLFTDGIPEQFDTRGVMFNVAGLERVFRENLHRPLTQTVEQIVQAIESFRGAAITKDDQTLLAIECLAPPTPDHPAPSHP
jgi:hypothetical protein